ncbi:hypothetical protein Agub_g15161 [Astrephomene gubernaculifera]|uniref:DNA polymerase alpha subunit B n=1 Tax=Astrephomene gubernaculifera TaxID=47775 RepID=A0AAD3E527_9CHLO|nr:hypothetical protein Agub_g15161 [Astrephomene gubernaculifera]
MAQTAGSVQLAGLEQAFAKKKYKLGDPGLVARAQQLSQQLHISPDAFANHYDSYALCNDWSMDVTAHRLKVVADYLEAEQRKENARPRAVPTGGVNMKGMPQAARPTWEDVPDKVDYLTPSAKRQALDPAAVNPGTGSRTGGPPGTAPKPTAASAAAAAAGRSPFGNGMGAMAGTPQQQQSQRGQGGVLTPGGLAGAGARTPTTAPPSAFTLRTNRGQVVAVLHEHLPAAPPAAGAASLSRRVGVPVVRPLGEPPLEAGGHLFMMELLEGKVNALDERILDFADALTAATRNLTNPQQQQQPAVPSTNPAAGTPGPAPPPPTSSTPPPHTPLPTPGGPGGPLHTPGTAAATPGGPSSAHDLESGPAQPLLHSVAEVAQQPVWVAGRILPEAEGAPLNPESLLLEGCREASGGARVRLDVSCLPGFRVFPGQSVCVYGLNPTGSKFIAQRLVTHVPPPAPGASVLAAGESSSGNAAEVAAAVRSSGMSMVVAAGPYCLTEDLSYSPLEELLSYCSAHPPDVLLLLGPFVDSEHPSLAAGSACRTAEELMREEVLRRLAAWRQQQQQQGDAGAAGNTTTIALMPAVRDMTALPVMPQPPLSSAAAAVGPPDTVVALQNPCTALLGPLVVSGGSSDLLKALSAAELSRVRPGAQVERLPALASHVLGQRSLYPLYPAPPGTCLDTSHYTQLQLPVAPDLLLLPSDLAPFAKVLAPPAWEAGAPPGLNNNNPAAGAGAGAGSSSSAAPVVVLNPGRLSRGGAGGTFAHVVVVPGAGPVVERTRVEVKRV